MNLAKYVTWDSLLATGVGLLFGLAVGGHWDDFVMGCLAFSLAQYLAYGFVYMNRIDRNVRELLLYTQMRQDIEKILLKLQEAQKEAMKADERG